MRQILFFGHRPYPNEHTVLENVFTLYLPRLGYRPIWILQPKTPEQSGIITQWNGTTVYTTRRRYWRGVLRHLELFFRYLQLGHRVLREHQVEIIQARTGLPEAFAAWWLAKRKHKAFVFQYSFEQTFSWRRKVAETKFSWLAEPLYRLVSLLIWFIMRQADLTLAISDEMCEMWKARGIKRIAVFPLGADTTLTPEQIAPVPAPPQTVIYFSSMHPTHDYTFLLDIFALVLNKMPTAHFLVVGDTTATNLKEYASQLGISKSITFSGRVPRLEVPRYIRAAVCSVAPFPPKPEFISVSSIPVVESLAMAVPVVSNCEIRDVKDIISRSGGGYAPPYEREAFAEAILALLSDPKDAARRGQQGRAYVVAHRSFALLSQQLERLYEDILSHHNASRAV